LVTPVRTTPVLVFVVVTVTPGKTASAWSTTRPLKVLVDCAPAGVAIVRTTAATRQRPSSRRVRALEAMAMTPIARAHVGQGRQARVLVARRGARARAPAERRRQLCGAV